MKNNKKGKLKLHKANVVRCALRVGDRVRKRNGKIFSNGKYITTIYKIERGIMWTTFDTWVKIQEIKKA